MSFNTIQDKAERAIQAVIRAAATGISDGQVFTTFSQGTEVIGGNAVSIQAQQGIEDGTNSGNYRLSVLVQVLSNLDVDDDREGPDPAALHRQLCGAVFDALLTTTLAADLSAAVDDFTVFPSIQRRLGRPRVENRKALSELLLEFSCAPSSIA